MSSRRLLLADDSVTIQKVINLTFADEGIDVITVGDGVSAIKTLAAAKPDVVLADVHMPGLNGYEVCEHIRRHEETKDLPVVLLVGSFEPFDEAEAARVGANAHLTKPFQSIRTLVDKVSELMEQTHTEPSDVDLGGDTLELGDPEKRETAEFPEDRQKNDADTSDIDRLYQASFAETVEIPEEELAPEYVDAGMDDEMIETVYAPDLTALANNGTPAPEHQTKPVSEEPAPEPAAQMEPPRSPFTELATAEDPASAPTLETIHTSVDPSLGDTLAGEDRPAFDDIDLLELPSSEANEPLELTTSEAAAEAGSNRRIVSISPELMEVIVQKVVERLSEKR